MEVYQKIISFLLLLTVFGLDGIITMDKERAHDLDRRLLLNDPQTILTQLEQMQREMNSLKSQVDPLQNKIQSLESLVSTQQTNIQSLQSQVNKSPDQESMTTYTVWGRKNCPQINGTTTVYSGISAGAQYNHGGGGSNTLCLTHNPDHAPSNFPTSKEGYAQLFGSEYQFTYKNYALDDDVPCAVCLVDHSSVILMIASKTTCPSGWNVQYRGFLTSQSTTDGRSPSEYLCLHDNAEYLTEGARQHNLNGRLFYPVMAICGSLPCPPYTNSQYITCVVCSK